MIYEIAKEVQDQSIKQGLTYIDDAGVRGIIPLMLRPRIIDPIQRSYFHYVCLQIVDASLQEVSGSMTDPVKRNVAGPHERIIATARPVEPPLTSTRQAPARARESP